MFDEISDSRLLSMWQKHLNTTEHIYKNNLKRFKLCGKKTLQLPNIMRSAIVISNGEQSRIMGTKTCHSSWACPKCTARVMAQYGTKIACAIDALATNYKQYAVMITFTLPHTKQMSCWESLEILRTTWRQFARKGMTKVHRKHTCKDGTQKTYDISTNAYNAMRSELGIKHIVRVFEITYGENGWHPHIHALFWVPEKDFNKIVDYEERLLDAWWNAAKNNALKFYGDQKTVDELYADYKKHPKTGHKSVFISRNENGTPRKQESSYYVVGWSGDFELANTKVKTARTDNHYSPNQILQMAYENPEEREHWLKIYDEYAEATTGQKRVQFSLSGINDIIKEWQHSNQYINTLKKKFTDRETGAWRVVIWFTEEQWSNITAVEDHCLIAEILTLARLDNGKQLITDMLIKFGINVSGNKRHPNQDELESRNFENRILDMTA